VSGPPKANTRLNELIARHAAALRYVCKVVLPLIFRTRRRPVIFSRQTGMGDIICTIPAARELKKRHPGAPFIYNCHASFTEIPRLAGVADLVTSLKPIGLVGHWYRFLLGGFYHFAHGDDLPDSGDKELMITEFCRQFNVSLLEAHPRLTSSAKVRETANLILARKNLEMASLVLIHPGPSWPTREWPHDKWTRLVAELRGRGFTNLAQLGVGHYMNFGKIAVEPIPGVVSLVDALSIEECIAVIAQAKLFIGIDSGLLHIAASTGTPSVGLFGMTFPEYRYNEIFRKNFVANRVDCAGCEHRKPRLHWVTGCPYDIKCMKTLPVEEVLQACMNILS
jgi:ADP-heptose:LPS heptosyltransferase